MPANKILIINAYSVKNRGDAAIVFAMIQFIRELRPTCVVKVMSAFPEINKDYYESCDAESIEAVWNIGLHLPAWKKYFQGLGFFKKAILDPHNAVFAPYWAADLVFSAGGGYLYSSRKGALGLGLVNSLFHIWLANRFKKKSILFPQSIGPLHFNLDRLLCKHVLKSITKIYSREKISLAETQRLSLRNVELIPDIAFLLARDVTKDIVKSPLRKVGISVLDWRFANAAANEDTITQYLDKIAQSIQSLRGQVPDLEVEIFPQVTVGKGLGDQEISQRLCDILNSPWAKVTSLEDSPLPNAIMNHYSRMDAFIGSRMHSAILALCAGTPTVAIAYQPKTRGTFEEVQISDFALDASTFTSEELVIKLQAAHRNKEQIHQKVLITRDRIHKSLEAITQ